MVDSVASILIVPLDPEQFIRLAFSFFAWKSKHKSFDRTDTNSGKPIETTRARVWKTDSDILSGANPTLRTAIYATDC
jgi:hypothetical protein